MQTITFINPLKAGRLEAYKTFTEEILGPRREEYSDLMKRYGLKTAKVYSHALNGQEFIIVVHDAEDDAMERLSTFASSEHPFDQWFFKQLTELHEFEEGGDTLAKHLFSFEA
ncbi:MAG: hypothetical protein KDK76_07690 [Chlamydiia bacterium]|nr:hypothetical protein [Chlamydiia bacterium]